MATDSIKNKFYLDQNRAYFNFGTFGIVPKTVLEEKMKYMQEFEINPQLGFSKLMLPKLEESIEILRSRFQCPGTNGFSDRDLKNYEMALIGNVTIGICAIMQSIPINEGDELLLNTWTYKAVTMTSEEIFVPRGGRIVTLPVDLDFYLKSEDEIVELYLNFVDQHPSLKYVVVDHIISSIPVVLPVKRLMRELRKRGIIVIIDGAHVAGQIHDFNIQELDPDIYVGNLHKWCFMPRATAFLIIRKDLCERGIVLRPPVVSWWHFDEMIHKRFVFLGTCDVTNYMCVKTAFEFIDQYGGLKAIHEHNSKLLNLGITHLEEVWNVSCLKFNNPAPFMRLIPLPHKIQTFLPLIEKLVVRPFESSYYKYTEDKFNICVSILMIEQKIYFRICCQITNTMDDFIKLGKSILEWSQLLENGISRLE